MLRDFPGGRERELMCGTLMERSCKFEGGVMGLVSSSGSGCFRAFARIEREASMTIQPTINPALGVRPRSGAV